MQAWGWAKLLSFGSSFYLLGVLEAGIASELSLPPALVSGLLSIALLSSAFSATPIGRWIDARGGKVVLMSASRQGCSAAHHLWPRQLRLPVSAAGDARPVHPGRGPVLFGLILDRSASLAIIASSAVCLFMFAVTFGLVRQPQTQTEAVPV